MIKRGKRRNNTLNQTLPDPEIVPDGDLNRDNTFLTNMNVAGHDIFRKTGGDYQDDGYITKKSNF
jgi:hypothetical protein